MAKQSGLLARIAREWAVREAQVRHHTQVYTLDMVTAALGRMGWGEKRLREFDQKLTEVSKDFADLIREDAEADPDLDYTKSVLDRELQQYTGSLFRPYDERYRL